MLFFLFFFGLGGPKLLQLQNLGGGFVVFFLGGRNRNFGKVRGLKLLLSQNFKHRKWECINRYYLFKYIRHL